MTNTKHQLIHVSHSLQIANTLHSDGKYLDGNAFRCENFQLIFENLHWCMAVFVHTKHGVCMLANRQVSQCLSVRRCLNLVDEEFVEFLVAVVDTKLKNIFRMVLSG